MEVLLIDHEDSFSYNLQQSLRMCGAEVRIIQATEIRNSIIDKYHHIILSPGPGLPLEYLATLECIDQFKFQKSFFGVCLGLQSIGVVFGAELFKQSEPQHGVVKSIIRQNTEVESCLSTLPRTFEATLYHSWAIIEDSLPQELVITSKSEDGIIMSIIHEALDIEAVQFHPESFLTQRGNEILYNWLYKKR